MASVYIIAVTCFFHGISKVSSASMRASVFTDPRQHFSPPDMLIVSSPAERKVSFAPIKNYKSAGVTLPIIDAGVMAPYGLAWDGPRSALYICDGTLKKIFRQTLKAVECVSKGDCKGNAFQLKADGDKQVIVDNTLSRWASVDEKGNLYYSDVDTKSINKINVEFIDMISDGLLLPKDLVKTNEPDAAGEEAAKESVEDDANATTKTAVTTPLPSIVQLYEADASTDVGTPSGVVASGPALYWANSEDGLAKGSVSFGKTNPRIKKVKEGEDQPSFPSAKLANNTASSFGIAVTKTAVVYGDVSSNLWAANRGTGEVVALSKNMLTPRGIVWDGAETVYVADQDGNSVSSVPVGMLKPNAPVTQTLDIHGPFGVALVRPTDPIWNALRVKHGESESGANRIASVSALAMVFLSVVFSTTA